MSGIFNGLNRVGVNEDVIDGGFISTTLTAAQQTITQVPQGSQVIGIWHNAAYAVIPNKVGGNSYIPGLGYSGTSGESYWRCSFTVQGTGVIIAFSAAPGLCIVYYGKPGAGSPTLERWNGQVQSNTFAAAGSATLNFSFPGKVTLTGMTSLLSVGTSYTYYSFSNSTGATMGLVDNSPAHSDKRTANMNQPAQASFGVSATAGAAMTSYLFLYYE